MGYKMSEDKIKQNAERLRNFLFHILGYSKKDAKRVIKEFVEKYIEEKQKKAGKFLRD